MRSQPQQQTHRNLCGSGQPCHKSLLSTLSSLHPPKRQHQTLLPSHGAPCCSPELGVPTELCHSSIFQPDLNNSAVMELARGL